MREKIVSWDEFKGHISDHIKERLGPRICRGQADPAWSLTTTFHRNPNGITFAEYFAMLNEFADLVGTIERRNIEIDTGEKRGSFVAHLQHHGLPTPILDFTLSPYIAAHFAFSDPRALQTEMVAVYVFDFLKWISSWKQNYDIDATAPHVTVLKPKSMGNMRQVNQQGYYYLFTNVEKVEDHVAIHEYQRKDVCLERYLIPSSERDYALIDLETMGINRYSLFGTTESFCAHLKEAIFTRTQGGMNAIQLLRDLMLKSNVPPKPTPSPGAAHE